jgi:hypothetical protein
VRGNVELVEPEQYVFDDVAFALVEGLCIDARDDRHSPRYLFAFERPSRVEGIRRLVAEHGLGRWRAGDPRIELPGGHAVLLGRLDESCPLVRTVVMCSGKFPNRKTLRILSDSVRVILLVDPFDPPTHAGHLRQIASL